MDSADEIMQVCRLCLVKEEVNTPIFDEEGDDDRIFLKISTCLPVKVSKEDNLPKNICDGCSSKLEELYEFWNKSASSEKKLVKWLCQLELDKSDKMQHSMNTSDPVILKQEVVDVAEGDSTGDDLIPEDLNVSNDAPDYMLQEQLPYQPVEIQFQQDGFETTSENSLAEKETKGKLCKRRAAAMKALASFQSEDEDDADLVKPKIAKTEDPSDESGEEPEPTAFVSLPSGDNEQPGPSGVGKSSNDAPELIKLEMKYQYEDDSPHSNSEQKLKRYRWSCNKCNQMFVTVRELREHRKVHRKQENMVQYSYKLDKDGDMFICLTCDAECKTKEEMEKHVLQHEEKFICDVCKESFLKPYEYTCHLFNHDPSKGFSCPFCKYVTKRRTAIMIHINTYHLRKYIYTCSQCGKGFNDCVLFKGHNNIHDGVKPFHCIVCSKEFAISSYLTSHQMRNHRVTIDGMIGSNQCNVCSKIFTRKNSLGKHMQLHKLERKRVLEKKHLCDICGKRFSRTDKLRIHYRVHTGIKPYTCSYCNKSFTKREYLVMHERVHSGEKPYLCIYCGKRFNQGASLRLHVRCHTGERPYRCHLCNTGFISRGVLNVHFRNCPGSSV